MKEFLMFVYEAKWWLDDNITRIGNSVERKVNSTINETYKVTRQGQYVTQARLYENLERTLNTKERLTQVLDMVLNSNPQMHRVLKPILKDLFQVTDDELEQIDNNI